MPDLSIRFAGIPSPNPFWLASGPPTNTAYQVCRAFEAGWGGAVWKTIGHDPPILNVSARYGGIDFDGRRLMGLNNIELISDRPLADNLRGLAEVKRRFPDRALIASVMVQSTREAWHDIVQRCQDTGIDGFELNFGCPHGMNERGMGSAVGQVPEYAEMITAWAKEKSRVPVLVKLTPNVTDIAAVARAAVNGGADGISLINTINSIMGVDLDTLAPRPSVGGAGAHGGYCGPAVKPVALHMVAAVAKAVPGTPVSGIGGIRKWTDAAEFLLLGATSLQVCTAVMHRGFGVIKGLVRGLTDWMTEKGLERIADVAGRSLPRIKPWGDLDLNHRTVAHIEESKCIHCGICYASCEDGCYQAIRWEKIPRGEYVARFGEPRKLRAGEAAPAMDLDTGGTVDVFTVKLDACVGCNMCALACPVAGCITMKEIPSGKPPLSWNQYQALPPETRDQALAE
jgi:dihydropyrimidine dehydrogenase (NAD+) subunit PreA